VNGLQSPLPIGPSGVKMWGGQRDGAFWRRAVLSLRMFLVEEEASSGSDLWIEGLG
jgi:hypothetical protein